MVLLEVATTLESATEDPLESAARALLEPMIALLRAAAAVVLCDRRLEASELLSASVALLTLASAKASLLERAVIVLFEASITLLKAAVSALLIA